MTNYRYMYVRMYVYLYLYLYLSIYVIDGLRLTISLAFFDPSPTKTKRNPFDKVPKNSAGVQHLDSRALQNKQIKAAQVVL